jgi:hypothetical protein
MKKGSMRAPGALPPIQKLPSSFADTSLILSCVRIGHHSPATR